MITSQPTRFRSIVRQKYGQKKRLHHDGCNLLYARKKKEVVGKFGEFSEEVYPEIWVFQLRFVGG